MQLMVYVGGTLVLLVFGVMLTARGPLVSCRPSAGSGSWRLLIGGALLAVLLQTVLSVPPGAAAAASAAAAELDATPTATPLGLGLMGVRVDRPASSPTRPLRAARPATCWPLKSFPSTCWSC